MTILRCIQDDALVTGVESKAYAGFCLCPVCQRRNHLNYTADIAIPTAKSPTAKSRVEHREQFVRSLCTAAAYELWRQRFDAVATSWFSSWNIHAGRLAAESLQAGPFTTVTL